MGINLIMSEFGNARQNWGDANLSNFPRLDPTLRTMIKYFPDLKLTLYTNTDIEISYPNTTIHRVGIIQDPKHPRANIRSSMYWKHYGLLKSNSEIAIALDSDLYIYSAAVKYIVPLTRRFGLCIPMNPRYLVKVDTEIGADSDKKIDDSGGYGFATNGAVFSFHRDNKKARRFMERYLERRLIEGRDTVTMWRTIWESGHEFNPYMLPIQWLVCKKHVGIGNEIILHVGHREVRKFYKV